MTFWDRREFLQFMGLSTLALGSASCWDQGTVSELKALGLKPQSSDQLELASGLSYQRVLSWGDPLSDSETFGFNCDFIAALPYQEDLLLWVNHEQSDPVLMHNTPWGDACTREQIELQQKSVGGSIVQLRQNAAGHWQALPSSPRNRRLDARTKISIDRPVLGAREVIGTLANCSGGVTPWGHILTCEENYHNFYGERQADGSIKGQILGWERFVQHPPEHYGWVVEVNPLTGQAIKRTSLGRFAHESATVTQAQDGRIVVYSGDDDENQCLYKYISEKSYTPGNEDELLRRGTLYVANLEEGRWIPLDWERSELLKKSFPSPTEMLINTRQAAKLLGATPLDRPEDIEVHPKTHEVFVSLTNNKYKNNPYGRILKIKEKNDDHGALHFKSSTLHAGGKTSGFACPDNLAIDRQGQLWMTTDISGKKIGKKPYRSFGNNGLFYIPLSGPAAGEVVQLASAPKDAELTGPCFSPDGKTLFLSVQHPGETSPSQQELTSHWPDGGNALPRPTVVAIQGPLLDKLTQGG